MEYFGPLCCAELFFCTGDAKDETMMVLSSCVSLYRNLSLIPEWVSNVHNWSQFTELFASVDLDITLVMSRMPL